MDKTTIKQWEDFSSNIKNIHILQMPAWGLLKQKFGWEVKYFVDKQAGAQILFKKFPLNLTLAYIPKGPIGKLDHGFWERLKVYCKKNRAIFIRVEPDDWDTAEDWRKLLDLSVAGKPIQPANTITVDISGDDEEILKNMKQKTRYNVRLAQKKDVTIELSDDIDLFYDIMVETGNRDEFGIHSLAYYQTVYDFFKKTNNVELLIAKHKSSALAGLMLFFNGERAWYFYGASNNKERNRMPTYLLQYEAMLIAKQRGCKTYDLWGIPDEPEEILENEFQNRSDGLWGVYRFKRGFGGEHKRSFVARDIVLNPFLYRVFRLVEKRRSL
ncbi:MAG: hypothetical protein CL609_12920 [Anaerolineaceae bacterium]|nr:hypothetical protein [Anaerolineaceae bacterium]